ncbi:hypothetical protein ACFHW1_26450 [Micromonospora sp. LOL_014]|uniref:hypothetical protein n=1 Tax=Micromonospora sp. LOL_014 TaxID=3345415 RepID=UPI003A8BFD0C
MQPTLPIPADTAAAVPLLLVDGHNLLWGATFGFPAPIYSRDKTRLLTGLFAFFALLRVAIRNEIPGGSPEVIVVWDGEHGSQARQQEHDGYKASRPTDDDALLPLRWTKITALAVHQSQPITEHFGPMAETLARLHGGRAGVRYAEAFAPVPVLGRLPTTPLVLTGH